MWYKCIMEVSSVQSSAKSSGSDFSIERILSDEPRSSRQTTEPSSWLYCTRYRPPKLPRSSSTGSSRRSGRHARVPFTAAQAAALEAAYAREPYLAPPALRALASALQLRDDRIKIWFQNRRARERREKCAVILPPHTTTLLIPTSYHPMNAPAQTVTTQLIHPVDLQRNNNFDCEAVRSQNTINYENTEMPSDTYYNDNSSDDDRSSSPVDIVTVDEE